MTWGWRKILQLHPVIRQFIWYRNGDGSTTSVWFDHWCPISPLSNIVSSHDIYSAGFDMSSKLKDIIANDNWMWPPEWPVKYPPLSTIIVPTIILNVTDVLEWRDMSGKLLIFLLLRFGIVFVLEVWIQVKIYAGLPYVSASLNAITDHIIPMSKKKNARSVTAKLALRGPTSVCERGSASTGHDYRGPLPDKGPTPATTIVGEMLESNHKVRPYGKANGLFSLCRESSESLGLVQDLPQMGKEKEQTSKNPDRPASDTALREYCDKHYHQLLPIIAEKVHNEKVQQEKLKEVKARLSFEECGIKQSLLQDTARPPLLESKDSGGGHWKSKSRKQKSSIEEEDLSQPWTCEEADPFTPRIRYFELPKKNSYDDLKKAFIANYLQQKNCIKDPIEIHHIKQRERESTEYFMWKKEILALNKGKFKAPPPMTTHVEKRNNNKFCEFHGQVVAILLNRVGKGIDKQSSGKDQPKTAKKGETSGKDKPLVILMVQPWQRVAKQKVTQSFSPSPDISFPPFRDKDGTEGPMIIEAKLGGHFIHRIYVDGGSTSEILYEHCFNKLRLEVKSQMIPATAPLIGLSGEII
ncbi:hypothetical protein Tco_1150413 [Tanacetum coccineum]